jgi:branched-chain amino acid transport system ATP-binding protein
MKILWTKFKNKNSRQEMSNPYVLQTRGLVKKFRGFQAVDHVDLQIRQGDIHALIGPNGAGKTTVFNLLTKFLIPTRGQILYKGEDITSLKSAAIARSPDFS